MRLDNPTIETVAIAISIAAGCEPCTQFHVKEARKLGATDPALMHMVALAGSGWGTKTASLIAVNEIVSSAGVADAGSLIRQAALAQIGMSVCQNGVRLLRDSIKEAQKHGISDEEIMEVIGLAVRIKEKAASHLDRVIERLDADPRIGREAASLCT